MTFSERTLVCRDCGADFTFSARDQQFHDSMGFTHEPVRCAQCRAARRAGRRPNRPWNKVTCASCGVETEVPFRPTGIRPVLCAECFHKASPEG